VTRTDPPCGGLDRNCDPLALGLYGLFVLARGSSSTFLARATVSGCVRAVLACGVVSRIVLYLIGLSVVRTVARPPAGGLGACCPVS